MYGIHFMLSKKAYIGKTPDTSNAENNIIYYESSSNIVRLLSPSFFKLFYKTNW